MSGTEDRHIFNSYFGARIEYKSIQDKCCEVCAVEDNWALNRIVRFEVFVQNHREVIYG